ncbi:phage tail protein I [Sphingomonas sanguinis]|uniref:phage tail protein I n=1 Tax=Sphingomonas sanguinis TaxID=33051 RepID=UPI0030159B2F
MTLLPPNATPLERALEAGVARISAIDTPIDTLLDPERIAARWLPWLAWGLSVDAWDSAWPEATKRQAVAESIALHRMKGTRASVDLILSRIDGLARVIEWHEDRERLPPHAFEIEIPLVTVAGAAGGARAQAAIVDDIIAAVDRVKPLREHLTVVQALTLSGGVAVQGHVRMAAYRRDDVALVNDTSPAWDFYLQTELGEPMQAEAGSILDTAI